MRRKPSKVSTAKKSTDAPSRSTLPVLAKNVLLVVAVAAAVVVAVVVVAAAAVMAAAVAVAVVVVIKPLADLAN